MNIKITKGEFDFLRARAIKETVFGSKLYGVHKENSDTDVMVTYDDFGLEYITSVIPIHHQFQYDDESTNTQYVFTTVRQFNQNLFSGDSTINSDIVIFDSDQPDQIKVSTLYSFKIIKAYLGFAKRDISNIKGKNKLFHVRRGLFTAECLLNKTIPTKEQIQNLDKVYPSETAGFYLELEKKLRADLHKLHADNAISDYNLNAFKFVNFESDAENSLLGKFLKSINTREFKY